MVRHEAAEALGGIGTPEVLPHLKEWMVREDSPRVVRESCQVAIDMWEVRDFLNTRALITDDCLYLHFAFCFTDVSMRIQISFSMQMG